MTFPTTPLPHQPPAPAPSLPPAPSAPVAPPPSRITWQLVVAILALLVGGITAAALYDSSDPWRSCASEKAAAEAARAATPSMPSIANKDTAVEDKYLRAAAARDAATATYNECVQAAKSGRIIMLIPGIGISLVGLVPLGWQHFGAGIADAAARRRADAEARRAQAAAWAAANPPQPAPTPVQHPAQFAGYQATPAPQYPAQPQQPVYDYPADPVPANAVQPQQPAAQGFSSPSLQTPPTPPVQTSAAADDDDWLEAD